jgi:carbon-monoxide dehydrogenase medium subunit
MICLEAGAVISGPNGEKTIPMTEFFKGPGKTILQKGELLIRLDIPRPLPRTGMAYWKHTRRKAMDLPILGVAVLLSFEEDMKTCAKARIGLGVAAPTPMRAYEAETFLEGRVIDHDVLAKAGEIAAESASPRTTIRGSEWYRRDMVRVLVKRTALLCVERARGGESD